MGHCIFIKLCFRLLCFLFILGGQVAASTTRNYVRPNFLVIITDDQRYDTMPFMPRVQARLIGQGVTFTAGYATTPLCCPSRASLLTGMYAHNHGVRVNEDPLHFKTFAERLHDSGYYTGLVGKYLNSWDGPPRPGFDYWVSYPGGSVYYYNPRLNVNGTWRASTGYVTHIFRDRALEFLDRAARQDKPFVLIFSPNAPHQPADPAPGDETLYPNLPLHRPPNFNEVDVSDKPAWLPQFYPFMGPVPIGKIDTLRRKQLQSLNALDQVIDNLLDKLVQQGRLDETVVLYISDNGYFWGEHRLVEKLRIYEHASRVPFVLRYPPLVQGPVVEERLVANIDIAPTLYQLAGLPIPAEVDGRSLVPLLQGSKSWREELLIEGWPQGLAVPPYSAIHTKQFVYVENKGDRAELYDLINDPDQLDNQVENPLHVQLIDTLKMRLQMIATVRENVPTLPEGFSLGQNYPNPLRTGELARATLIRFSIPRRMRVKLTLFDNLGRPVRIFFNREVDAGEHVVAIDKINVASGVYFYQMEAGSFKQQRGMIVIR